MDITVYLPDEIGAWAKASELNLSRLLRDAVEEEKGRQEAVADALEGAEEIELDLESDEGHQYVGTFVGNVIAKGEDSEVYLTDDERLVIYRPADMKAEVIESQYCDEEHLAQWLDHESYLAACVALGLRARVAL